MFSVELGTFGPWQEVNYVVQEACVVVKDIASIVVMMSDSVEPHSCVKDIFRKYPSRYEQAVRARRARKLCAQGCEQHLRFCLPSASPWRS